MSSQPAERMTSRYRPALAIGIVVLSLVLPVVVAGWSVLAEMRDKGIAMLPSKVVRYHIGSVRKGELWHAEILLPSNVYAPPVGSRVLRLDLETGVERDTGLSVPGEFGWPQWIEGTLYFITQTAVYRQSDDGFVKLATMPPRPASFYASLFLWEGRLTTIREIDDGSHRMMSLSDGEWIDGRPILLPDATRVWHDDVQRGRRILLPRTSQPPASTTTRGTSQVVAVVQHGQQHHVMISDYRQFSAYRTGFEFADEACEAASALAPQNAARDISGWEAISSAQPNANQSWIHMSCSREGLMFLSWDSPMHLARRKPDGTWDRLLVPRGLTQIGGHAILSDPDDDTAYIIGTNQIWGSAEVRRIEGNTVHPSHLVIPGYEREYLARWKRLGVSLLFAWWLHAALLIGGAAWLSRGAARAEYEFGIQRVTLAPLWRRGVATGVDAALLFTAVYGLWRFFFAGFGIETPAFDETNLAHAFYEVEGTVFESVTGIPGNAGFVTAQKLFLSPVEGLRQTIRIFPQFTVLLVTALLVIVVAKVFVEGRYGITPGKWLLGLRTVRTTLRPCGFARALVRNLVYYVDLPLLLTPLPAAMSLMFSDHRQRLGDRVADTLVIRAGSICDAKSS